MAISSNSGAEDCDVLITEVELSNGHPRPLDTSSAPIESSDPRVSQTVFTSRPYNDLKQDQLLLSVKAIDSPGRFKEDLFDILSIGVNEGSYLPGDVIPMIISKALYWSHEHHCYLLFDLLSRDLILRKKYRLKQLKKIIDCCFDAISLYVSSTSSCPSPSTSFPSLAAVLLTLQYIISVFQRDVEQCCAEEEREDLKCLVDRIKPNTLEHTVRLLFDLVKCDHTHQSLSHHKVSDLVRELLNLVCLPLLSPSTHNTRTFDMMKKVALNMSMFLSKVSFVIRRQILLQLPSLYLQQTIIDYHLETEYKLHSSATHFQNTELYRSSSMSLNKFCCVHLCRLPYTHSGELHSLSFFLFLLSSLLKNHIQLLIGFPVVHQPLSLSCTTPQHQALGQVSEELSVCLASIKPHIERLVERLSEDENLIVAITEQECWRNLQLLVDMTEVTSPQS